MKFYLYITAIVILDLTAITLIKFWHLKHHAVLLILGMLSLGLTGLFMGLSLKYEGVAIVNIIWVVLSVIATTAMGYLYFKEPISVVQFVGIAIIIIGLIIVESGK